MKPPLLPIGRRGAALIIVLAFVVLISVIVTAVFSRTTAQRQVSHSSSKQTVVDELARSALAIVVSSLRQEIVTSSTTETIGDYTLYIPMSAADMLPQRNGSWPEIPNLVRISSQTKVNPPGVDLALASKASSATASANGRSISKVRWNRHVLVPRKNASKTISADITPVDSFPAPQWVYVTDRGPEVLTAPTSKATGRYAYAVYHEGGLLDMNVAGYPPLVNNTQTAEKGVLAFADLTCIGLSGSMVNTIVGWRNYVTAGASGTSVRDLYPNDQTAYCQAVLVARDSGFLKVGGRTHNDRTDQAFLSRQELLCLRNELSFVTNALPHMGTFSRAVTAPTRFHEIRLGTSGTCAHYGDKNCPATTIMLTKGEPLLRSRFSLARLNWIAHPETAPAGAVQACFGITGMTGSNGMVYVGPTGGDSQPIKALADVAAEDPPREPNFFELLKACVSHTGGPLSDPEVLSTGSAIIAAYQANSGGFQSVGGLCYALDFWSAGYDYSPLLDVFSAVEEPAVTAGKFNPNQSHDMVFYSMISGGASDAQASGSGRLSATDALNTGSPLAKQLPITNESGLVSAIGAVAGSLDNHEKNAKGALVALASVSNVRTWNLLIDVVAQSGVFPPSAASLDGFVVQSERRYWLHVAIDRYTGKVVDQMLEPVYE